MARGDRDGAQERYAETCCRKPSSSGCKRSKGDDGVEHRCSKTALDMLKVITESGLRCKKYGHASCLQIGFLDCERRQCSASRRLSLTEQTAKFVTPHAKTVT